MQIILTVIIGLIVAVTMYFFGKNSFQRGQKEGAQGVLDVLQDYVSDVIVFTQEELEKQEEETARWYYVQGHYDSLEQVFENLVKFEKGIGGEKEHGKNEVEG